MPEINPPQSCRTLLLDVSHQQVSVVVANGVGGEDAISFRSKILSSNLGGNVDVGNLLLTFTHSLLKELNISLADMQAIIIVSGPGSYTALRILFGIAKMWCYVYGLRLFSFSQPQIYALGWLFFQNNKNNSSKLLKQFLQGNIVLVVALGMEEGVKQQTNKRAQKGSFCFSSDASLVLHEYRAAEDVHFYSDYNSKSVRSLVFKIIAQQEKVIKNIFKNPAQESSKKNINENKVINNSTAAIDKLQFCIMGNAAEECASALQENFPSSEKLIITNKKLSVNKKYYKNINKNVNENTFPNSFFLEDCVIGDLHFFFHRIAGKNGESEEDGKGALSWQSFLKIVAQEVTFALQLQTLQKEDSNFKEAFKKQDSSFEKTNFEKDVFSFLPNYSFHEDRWG